MKTITFGLPDKPDLGDTLLLTPLFKHSPGCTMQFNRTARGAALSELFKGLTNIEFVNKTLSELEYFEKYGDPSKKIPLGHACKNYCSIFGIETDDFIPTIWITKEEQEFAQKFIQGLRNPIVICPIAGGFASGCPKAVTKMVTPEIWNYLTKELSQKHDILYFSGPGTNFPIENTIEMFGLTVRQMCAIFQACGKVISIENGLLHTALASGATVHALVEGFGWNSAYFFGNYGYTDDMWNHEPKRCFYYQFNNFNKILENF